jgi:ABC-2 type transport system ATP-binding protein
VIEIRELYKYFGDRRAVGPLSATIEKGEIVGLLGLNGAGKTTTLRVLACDLLPTSGTVRVGGFDVVEHPDEVRARIGYLPDIPPLYGEMTVREYLEFVARLRGVTAAEVARRVSEVVDLTEVGDERDNVIGALSHGFRQRVGIAQAIVHRPEFVVLDEPISGLDPVQIVEMRSLIRSLGGEHTVVVSSHILNEIHETCDRIFVIRDGEIVASGTEAELSSKLLEGMLLDLTLRAPAAGDGEAAATALIQAIAGVREIEPRQSAERGAGIIGLRVHASGDVRDALCRKLIDAGFGLLELTRAERELENVFLKLAESTGEPAERRKKRRQARAEARAEKDKIAEAEEAS